MTSRIRTVWRNAYTGIKQGQLTMAIGWEGFDMELGNSFGQMDPSILENGEKERLMVKESSFTQTEITTREIGATTRLADMVYTFMKMEISMRENGKMTFNMDMAKNVGQTALVIKDLITKEQSMV